MFFLNESCIINESNVYKRYTKILKNLNIPYVKFHISKHTFSPNLLKNGIHSKISQTILGHSEIKTSMEIHPHVLHNITGEAIEKTQWIVQSLVFCFILQIHHPQIPYFLLEDYYSFLYCNVYAIIVHFQL